MPATPDDLFAFLDKLGIAHPTITHPPVFTVEEAKRLFLKDKRGAIFLVTALEHAAIDLKTLHHRLGAARFSFGPADLLRELLGVEPGSVTPFRVINDTGARVPV